MAAISEQAFLRYESKKSVSEINPVLLEYQPVMIHIITCDKCMDAQTEVYNRWDYINPVSCFFFILHILQCVLLLIRHSIVQSSG